MSSSLPQPSLPRRTKVSCLLCRQRKSKCDQARPCSSCVLRGTSHQCSDPPTAATTVTAGAASTASRSDGPLIPVSHPVNRQPKRRRLDSASASASPARDILHTNSSRAPQTPPQHSQDGIQDALIGEIAHIKQGLSRLEELLTAHRTTPKPDPVPSSTIDGIEGSEGVDDTLPPLTPRSKQMWSQLRALLPPLIDIHFMMHYAFFNAHWLMEFVDFHLFIHRWKAAFLHEAISDVFAASVLALVALSSIFLADNSQRALQIAVPIRTLHGHLIQQATRILDDIPIAKPCVTESDRCDLIECYHLVSLYFRCIDDDVTMVRYTERALSLIVQSGLGTEAHHSWVHLSDTQVERRRLLVFEASYVAKWIGLHARRIDTHETIKHFNVGLPSFRHFDQFPSFSAWPASQDFNNLTVGARMTSTLSFVSKTKNSHQIAQARTFSKLLASIADEIPAVVELIATTEAKLLSEEAMGLCSKDELRKMARKTRLILNRLEEWRTEILPRAGYDEAKLNQAFETSPFRVDTEMAVYTLMLNHSAYYMKAAVCRAWILLSDRLNRIRHRDDGTEYELPQITENFLTNLKHRAMGDVQLSHASWLPASFLREIEQESIDNAKRSISSVPLIKAMQANPDSQFYAGWISASFFQAALALAIPLLRSQRRREANDSEVSSSQPSEDLAAPAELGHYILIVLEALSHLSDNTMAKKVGKLLNKVMRTSGIRHSASDPMQPHWPHRSGSADSSEETSATSGLMKNAAEGLALLSAAPASAVDQSGRSGSLEWRNGLNEEGGRGAASGASTIAQTRETSAATSLIDDTESHDPAASQVTDSQIFEELLKLDVSFWDSVMEVRPIE